MLPTRWVVSRPNESTTESTTTVVVSTRASKTGAQAAKIRRKVDEVFVEYLGGSPALAAEILQNRRIQELLADENPDHVARAFGEAIEAADAAGASSSEVVRFADAVLPHLVEQLVPVCVSKFQGALEQIQLAHQASAAKAAEAQAHWQHAIVQRLDATLKELNRSTGRPVVNINTSARHERDLEKINVDAPENPEDVARHIRAQRCWAIRSGRRS